MSAAEAAPLLAVRDLVRHFQVRNSLRNAQKGAVVRAVDGVTFDVRRGEILAVVGESGSGKTTLGRLLARLSEPTSGEIIFNGQNIAGWNSRQLRPMRRKVQMVFQDPFSSLDPKMTVERLIAEPLVVHGLAKGRRAEAVARLLRLVGLDPSHAGRYPHQFSGGQRQRIGIARALSVEPELLIGDEPISALDVSVRAQILNLIAEMRSIFGFTAVIITHDLGVVQHIADRVLVLYLGKVVEIGTTQEVFRRPRHPYARALLAATPAPFRAAGPASVIEGEVPSPISPPSGCRFHTRCPMARPVCSVEEPALAEGPAGHFSACHFANEVEPLQEGGNFGHRSAVLEKRLERMAVPPTVPADREMVP